MSTVVETLTFSTMEEVAQFLNDEFPDGKTFDGNKRRGVVAKTTKFTSVDVANYVRRGQLPPKYLRAGLSTKPQDKGKPVVVMTLLEPRPSSKAVSA